MCLLQRRNGEIWIGSHGGGVSRYRDGRVEPVVSNSAYGNIYCLFDDRDGFVWVGTASGGLIRISDSGEVASVNVAQGLQGDEVLGIIADDKHVWVSSARGISRLRRQRLMDVCDRKVPRVEPLLIDKSDGMASAECNGGVSPSAARMAERRDLVSDDARRGGDCSGPADRERRRPRRQRFKALPSTTSRCR